MRRTAPPLPPLLPSPRHARRTAGAFTFRADAPIVLASGGDEDDAASARALADAIHAASGRRPPLELHARRDGFPPHVSLARGEAAGKKGDAYRVRVAPDGVRIAAGGRAGLRYAVETLAQLVDARGRIPGCEIDDAPDFEKRGIMLDVSRGKVPTAASLRELVDLLVRMKLNVLMLYTEHTFRFRRHPQIGRGWSPLDAKTLRALDAYAAERHVELVPTLQSLGHMDHVLTLPAYAHLAETERRWTLALSEPGSYALLRDLFDEYLPIFRSRLFNANCDEPWDLGRGRSAALDRELGPGGLYLSHLGRVRELAAGHGKQLLVWGDVVHAHPERIPELDRDVVLLDWGYEADADFDRVQAFAKHGFAFWVCPGTSSWNSLFPRVANAWGNVAGFAAAGRRHGASGLLNTDWGDFGHFNLQGFSWLGYAHGAQEAWSGAAAERDFDRAFSRLVFGDASGAIARSYRDLGACHEAGFPLRNASPLLALYFDDLGARSFVPHAQAAVLRRTERRLERARRRIVASRARFAREPRTFDELVYAADTSLFAVRKGLAGLAWLSWARAPARVDAASRRALARRLAALASEQTRHGARLRRLWLRRAQPGGFQVVQARLRRSIRALRAASRAAARGKPPAARA